jgi:hypothetical protein
MNAILQDLPRPRPKAIPLKNYINGNVNYDTLHSKADRVIIRA